MDTFVKKWEICAHKEWNIISQKTKKEVEALKKHITKGCLSDIPKGGGTTRNEAFHRVLNAHFGKVSRIGIPLALALLTIIIYQHNCKISEKVHGKSQEPLSLLKKSSNDLSQSERFGVVRKDDSAKSCVDWITQKLGTSEDIDLNVEHIDLSEEVLELISVSDLVVLLQNAINLTHITDLMGKKTASSPLLDPLLFPFMSSVSNIIFHGHRSTTESSLLKHQERLDQITKAWKFKIHPILGDGNCFFSAVAFSLIIKEQEFIQHDPNFFFANSLETNDQKKLGMKLRELIVKEWKNNVNYYQDFVQCNVDEEADKFLQSGVYCGELGDTMVLALANALQVSIIVLSSIQYHPIINILPRQSIAPVSLFLAYNQYGPGHYDGLIEEDATLTQHGGTQPLQNAIASHCSCGKNDKNSKTHCHPKTHKYTSVCFCPCYNKKIGCSDHCRCKSCSNPIGKRTTVDHPPAKKRPRHIWQKPMKSSANFASKAGERINPGSRSLLEFFAMEQVFSHCINKEISSTAENIVTMVRLVVSHGCVLPLGEKSTSQVETFMREHEHNLYYYKTLCIAGLELED